jgi:cysteine-rich repeat protein
MGCGGDDPAASSGSTLLCGNSVIEGIEECDHGGQNSDSSPNTCRTDCRLPWCGDGTIDSGESCDDGDEWGGDGCSPVCTVEEGTLEVEPNELPGIPQSLSHGDEVLGALPPFDVDCYNIVLDDAGVVYANILPEEGDGSTCSNYSVVYLLNDAEDIIAYGWPNEENGCAYLDSQAESSARYLSGGNYYICVEGLYNATVPAYNLQLTLDQGSGALLVFPSANWSYWDQGTLDGETWFDASYDDSAWSVGMAPLGYGDDFIYTLVSYGEDDSLKHITTYFRITFDLLNPPEFESLALGLICDDGCLLYLNGSELLRHNLPSDGIFFDTLATGSPVDETAYTWFYLPADLLQNGTNLLAAETHQSTSYSSDIAFDLELWGE